MFENSSNRLSVSVVIYKQDSNDLLKFFKCFRTIRTSFVLFVIDNSPTDEAKNIVLDFGFRYYHNPRNNGYGGGHNIAMKLALEENFKYNVVLNSDIFFDSDIFTVMLDTIISDEQIGILMPKILNQDLSVQYLPKLLPSPIELLVKKMKFLGILNKKIVNKLELRFVDEDQVFNAPVISGCFMMVNLDVIKKVGFFDEQYFLYFEDWDLSRRVHAHHKTLYFPVVKVIHGYESGANKKLNLFITYIRSAIIYYRKWGWWYDENRVKYNKTTLSQFNKEN